MNKRKVIATLLSVALLSGCATAQNAAANINADAVAKSGVKASEKAVLEAIKGFKDKYKVEQGIDPEVLTHYLEYDKDIIKDVKVDDSKIKWNTPGTYDAIYTINATLPDEEEKNGASIEVTEKVPVQIMTPEEIEEDKSNGGDAISKEEFEADKAEENKKPEQIETAKPSEDNKKPESEDKVEESKPAEDNKKPESNTAKPSGSKPETNAGSSKPTTSNKPAEKPSHTHSWEAQYKTVQHAEIGHNEQYVIKEAWTEYVPNYVLDEREICNGCGADMTNWSADQVDQHFLDAVSVGNMLCGAWHSEFIQIQIGTTPVNHPAEYGTRYVVDKPAWTEKVLTGYKCSCGATKN